MLDRLGFSVQRPRKLLCRADHEAQAHWLKTRLPAIKKARRVDGIMKLRARPEIIFPFLQALTVPSTLREVLLCSSIGAVSSGA